MAAVSRRPSAAGLVVAVLAAEGLLLAHGRDARYVQEIPWRKGHITRAIAASRSELGLSGSKRKLEMRTVDDQSCAVASLIAFDVDVVTRSMSTSRSISPSPTPPT